MAIDADTLSPLLQDLESDRVERTVSTTKTDKFAEAICAFANDFAQNHNPGYLIIGATDSTGQIAHVEITDQLLLNLASIRSDGNIQPLPAMTVQKVSFGDQGDIAVVEVYPSELPPVRYKGRVWIRVGPRRAIATEQEESLLIERRTAAARTFDARPCMESSISDLSIRLFEDYRSEAVAADVIVENHRPIEQQLASLRFLDPQRKLPTHAGILLFGDNPRYYLPGAYVQYLLLPGKEITDVPIDQAEIDGDLRTILEQLLLRVRVLNSRELHPVSALQEELRPKYPEVALREILINAVVHRNYESTAPIRFSVFSDRVEIASPGGLYGEVTRENFLSQSSYRNPILAEALKVLGFINRFGYGIRRADQALANNGSRALDIEITNSSVLVTIWGR